MKQKMKPTEKFMLFGSLIILILGIVIKSISGFKDVGILVALAFLGVLMWGILAASAFFPADWRMTDKQRAKITDMEKYQRNYRKVFFIVNLVVAIVFTALIMLIA